MAKCILYSVYPKPIVTPIGQFGSYTIPAADDPAAQSPVAGCSQKVIDDRVLPSYKGQRDGTGEPRYDEVKFEGHEIIDGYVLECFPGRGLFRLKEDERLTPQRVEEARKELQAFFVAEFNQADSAWATTGKRMAISDLGREAARYLGMTPPWVTEMSVRNVPCPACGENIKSTAVKCRFCQTVLNEAAFRAVVGGVANEPEPVGVGMPPPRAAVAGASPQPVRR